MIKLAPSQAAFSITLIVAIKVETMPVTFWWAFPILTVSTVDPEVSPGI